MDIVFFNATKNEKEVDINYFRKEWNNNKNRNIILCISQNIYGIEEEIRKYLLIKKNLSSEEIEDIIQNAITYKNYKNINFEKMAINYFKY